MRWQWVGLVGVGSASVLFGACGDDTTPMVSGSGGVDPTTGAATTTVGSSESGMPSTGDDPATTAADTTAADTTAGSESTGPVVMCGNTTLEGDEVCDGTELSGATCVSQGFDAGRLACADDCSAYDESGCTVFSCGNGAVDGKDLCDGADLAGATCVSEGFTSGTLLCDDDCLAFDTSGCGTCGNVIVDGDEACDDIVLFGQTCLTQGFDSGELACQADCLSFDTSGCGTCGNDLIDGGEPCDTAQLGGEDCLTQGFDSGTLGCGASCDVFDTEGCGICGNGFVDGSEMCDGPDVGAATCVTQGFDSGALGCLPGGCGVFDTAGCGICGNGITDGFEACDDGDQDNNDECPNNCSGPDRVVFVTSVMFNGDFGGLVGADAQCQALATTAGLAGTFLAWLSTDTESPSTRMTQGLEPYVRTDGVQVAPNWAGLIDGTLDAPINVTELGGPVPVGNTNCAGGGFPTVWTSTASNATSQGSACTNWTSNVGSGRWGRADEVGGSWTSWCVGGLCDWVSPIYCVQQ